MKLTNFEQTQSISIQGLGRHWDLHNLFDFAGIELLPESNSVRLRWEAIAHSPSAQGFPWENVGNRCAIRFDGVNAVWMAKAKESSGPGNARTLHQMGLVDPLELTPAKAIELGVRIPATRENGHYRFEFMDGFDIEIAASEATLEAESSPAATAEQPPLR